MSNGNAAKPVLMIGGGLPNANIPSAQHPASKNERFKKQPKQSSNVHSTTPMDYNDVIRTRKNNQSSIQMVASHIIDNNSSSSGANTSGRPSHIGSSAVGLPSAHRAFIEKKMPLIDNSNSQQNLLSEGSVIDNYSDEIGSPNIHKEMILEKNTDDYVVDMKKGNANILVAVRCRPLSKQEKQKQSQKSVKILDEKIIIIQDISAAKPEEAFRIARSKEKTYAFDYAFDENCGQSYIFERTTKFLIDGIMQGYNASVFAYGATGAGKTYTMLGTEDDPGIMMLSIEELFRSIELYSTTRDYMIKVSYVEVYNENIKDLLVERGSTEEEGKLRLQQSLYINLPTFFWAESKFSAYFLMFFRFFLIATFKFFISSFPCDPLTSSDSYNSGSTEDMYLDLREDNVKGVLVAGVTEIMTTNVEEIAKYLRQGNRMRTKERTDANETSSRSHAVLQITVEHKDKAHGISAEINIAKLSLIDLAGSERASNTNNRGMRLIEGANINKSLLALGNCINALCELTKLGGPAQKQMHIPYRDSKLTRLLKDSLGGNCRTVMITNISPAFAAYEDTLNTLKYADRAKQIKTIVKRNVLNVEFHISNYTKIINQLRDEIIGLRSQLAQGAVGSRGQSHGPSGAPPKQNQAQQNKLRTMKIDMNLKFEKEIMIKKDIYEHDMRNEDLAFKLFSKQLYLGKNKNKTGTAVFQQAEVEVIRLKEEI